MVHTSSTVQFKDTPIRLHSWERCLKINLLEIIRERLAPLDTCSGEFVCQHDDREHEGGGSGRGWMETIGGLFNVCGVFDDAQSLFKYWCCRQKTLRIYLPTALLPVP